MGEIKKQSINNTFLSYIGAGIGFLIIFIQPHLISSSDIGLLRLLYSFSWMAAIIMPFGFGNVIIKYFPKIKNDSNAHNGVFALLLIIASIGAFIIAAVLYVNKWFFIDYYKRSAEFPNYFNEALLFAFILSLVSLYTSYSISLFKTTITVFLTDIFTRLGQLSLIVIYHFGYISKNSLVLAYIGVFLVQLILLMFYLFKNNAVSFKINWNFFKKLEQKEILFFALLMMVTAFSSLGIKFIDQLMIGHYLNENLVGVYATCVMICAVMDIPFNGLERIAQPKIAYAWNINDVKEVSKIYEMSSRYMFFLGAVLFCVLWSSIDIIFLYLPAEYGQGKIAFYVVSCSTLVNLLTGVNSSVILNSSKYYMASLFLIVLISVAYVGNSVLIKSFGITGAAMSTFIAVVLFNFLKYLYILIKFKMQPFSKHTLIILACMIIILVIISMIPSAIHPFLKSIIGSILTLILFAAINYRSNTIFEINKVLKRFKIIK